MDFLDFLPLFLRSFLAKVKEVIKVMMKNIYKNFFIKCSVFLFMKNIYIINLLKLNQNKFKNSFELPCHSRFSSITVTVYLGNHSAKNVIDFFEDCQDMALDGHVYKNISLPGYISNAEYKQWEELIMNKHINDEWIQTNYWKLEKYSNVLVLRNKLWFKTALPKIIELWNIIITERIAGCEHRAPKKRKSITDDMSNKCLINVI